MAVLSQQSLSQLDQPQETAPYESAVHSVIPNGRVRVVVTKHRTKIHLTRVQQSVARLFLNDDDTDYYDESPDLQVGYRRPELVNQTADVNDGLSDEVKIRLLIARTRALEAYHKKWG